MKMFVRDLTVIDASRLCLQRGLVGESWLVDVMLDGELNEMSMLLDFGRVKKQIKTVIDAEADHRLLVPMQAAGVHYTPLAGGRGWLDFEPEQGHPIYMQAPQEAFCLMPVSEINAVTLADWLHQRVLAVLPSNVTGLQITLRQEVITGASYHYSHGLKKHDGNCQRIAHGHRSTIELWVDGVRDAGLEQQWATRWQDIYLGTEEDQVPVNTLALSERATSAKCAGLLGFSYQAPQGLFQLAIHPAVCEVIDTDTTVELLADYIARQLAPTLLGHRLQVVAYEGVGKGAVVERQG